MYIYNQQHFDQCCEYIDKKNIFGANVTIRNVVAIMALLGGMESIVEFKVQLALNPIDIGSNPVDGSIIEIFRINDLQISDSALRKVNNFFNAPPVELLYAPDIDFSFFEQGILPVGVSLTRSTPLLCKTKLMDYLSLMWSESLRDSRELCKKYSAETTLEAMVELFQDGADLESWCFPVKSISNHRVKSFFESAYGDNSHIIIWRTWFHDIEYNGDIYKQPSPLSAHQHVRACVSVNSNLYPIGVGRGYTFDLGNVLSAQDVINAISITKNSFILQTYEYILSYLSEQNLTLDELIELLRRNNQTSFTSIDDICSDNKIEVDVVIAEALSRNFSCNLKQRKKSIRESSSPLFPHKATAFSMNYYVIEPSGVDSYFVRFLDISLDEIETKKRLDVEKFDREKEFVTLLANHLSDTCLIVNGKKIS
jgi:hypothetical protein